MASAGFSVCSGTTQVWMLQAWMVVLKHPSSKKKKKKNRGNIRCNLMSAISPGLHFSCPCQGFDLPGTVGRDSSPISGVVEGHSQPSGLQEKGKEWPGVGGV